ncbi:MAG: hypothetical protein U0936_02855 [Planctomycetaceae bacterium]
MASMGLHRNLRLAAPWELSHREDTSAKTAQAASYIKLPLAIADLVLNDPASDGTSLLLSRKFHRPTGIDSSTRVFIEIELDSIALAAAMKAIVLNKATLPISSSHNESSCVLTVDISGQLMPFNELQLQLLIAESHTSSRLLSVTLMIEAVQYTHELIAIDSWPE